MDSQLSNVSDISFFHIASVYQKATEITIKNIREHHPNNFYYLAIDGIRSSYFGVAEEYNCDYTTYENVLGGPVPPYGYDLPKTLEFLKKYDQAEEKKIGRAHV